MALLRHKLEEEKTNRVNSLASGSAKDYPQYKELIGTILGLDAALKLLDETNAEIAGGG